MKLEVKRFADNGDATMSVFFIDGIAKCFGIEDEERKEKITGETRVPEGTYDVLLRAEGGYHNRETERYKDTKPGWHKGMLCIHNAPDWKIVTDTMSFQYILIHAGNTEADTSGCYLPNTTASFATFTGGASRTAYEKLYPIVRDALLKNEKVTITYYDIETGK